MAVGDRVYIADKETLDRTHANTVGILAAIGQGQHGMLKRYGIKIEKNNSGAAARVEYILDAVGMTPAHMDFENGVFDYGSWEGVGFVGEAFNYPCMVKSDGTEDYKLDPNNYALRKGTDLPSDVDNTAYAGNAMAAFVGGWLCQYETATHEYIIWCSEQWDETYHAYHRMDEQGNVRPGFYRRIYTPGLVDNVARSISGLQPMASKTAEQEHTAIKANGTAWEHTAWSEYNYITALLKIMGKSENCQAVFGNGNMSGYVDDASQFYGVLPAGTMDDKGQFFGYNTGNQQIKVFHTEAMWGDQWERLIGLVCANGKLKVSPYGPYNWTGEGYVQIIDYVSEGIAEAGGQIKQGWPSKTICSQYGRFTANRSGGSASTYLCDYFYINPDIVAVALGGGNAHHGAYAGPGSVGLNSTRAAASWNIAPGLSCKMPLAA